MKPRLCLNAIVKNEADKILRMLNSCKDHISSFAILDTGSTDDTVKRIHDWSSDNLIKGIVESGHFENFSQARNDALTLARKWFEDKRSPWFDFLLLMDADMELVALTPTAFEHLPAQCYTMIQKAGGISYHNSRLLHVSSPATYKGVTHEYLDAPATGHLTDAFFVDHADGTNRADKFTRDIRLLRDDLDRDPKNARSWFYLANSYRDSGDNAQAVAAYRQAIQFSNWDEEIWNCRHNLAMCLKAQGLEDAFVKEALIAYNFRPQRGETLFEIAKHYREKGENNTAMLFTRQGINMERPDDLLFVSDWVYNWGFREEYSIAGFYRDETRERAFRYCSDLSLDPQVPEHNRNLARANIPHYLLPLKKFCPSTEITEINFSTSHGWHAMNPSITNHPDGHLEVLLRTVNYKIDEHGRYMIGEKECHDAPIETENFLLRLGDDLGRRDFARVQWDRPPANFPLVIGLEDMRIFWNRGTRHFSATVRERLPSGVPQIWHGELVHSSDRLYVDVIGAEALSDGTTCEKNWMPITATNELQWMYNAHTVKDHNGLRISTIRHADDVIRGSSQLVPFKGEYLAVVHEAHFFNGQRVYSHRFVKFDNLLGMQRFSLPFCFEDKQIEFCAGMAIHPNFKDMVLSFGSRDNKAKLARVSMEEIDMMFGGWRR